MTFENNYSESTFDAELSKAKWWKSKRRKYNIGLVTAGIIAFIIYAILASFLIEPYDKDFEISLFTIGLQGFGYLIMIGAANLFYNLGPWADNNYNKDNDPKFRQKLFNLGFWFSFSLPFVIPVLVIITYWVHYKK
jgi:hypothetical protein